MISVGAMVIGVGLVVWAGTKVAKAVSLWRAGELEINRGRNNLPPLHISRAEEPVFFFRTIVSGLINTAIMGAVGLVFILSSCWTYLEPFYDMMVGR